MLYNIYTLNYNNYYNRKFKRESSLEDYLSHRIYKELKGVNFNSADGVSTTITNIPSNFGEFNYAIVCDTDDNIISRWFIIDQPMIKEKMQSILMLKRDSVADYLDEVLTSTAYIEKGWVNDDSPLSIVKEPVSLNQIKKGEFPLIDNIGTWKVPSGFIGIYFKEPSEYPRIDTLTFAKPAGAETISINQLATIIGCNVNTLRSFLLGGTTNCFGSEYEDRYQWEQMDGAVVTKAKINGFGLRFNIGHKLRVFNLYMRGLFSYNLDYTTYQDGEGVGSGIWDKINRANIENTMLYNNPNGGKEQGPTILDMVNEIKGMSSSFANSNELRNLVSYIINNKWDSLTKSQLEQLIQYDGYAVEINGNYHIVTFNRYGNVRTERSLIINELPPNDTQTNDIKNKLISMGSTYGYNLQGNNSVTLMCNLETWQCISTKVGTNSINGFTLPTGIKVEGEPYQLLMIPYGCTYAYVELGRTCINGGEIEGQTSLDNYDERDEAMTRLKKYQLALASAIVKELGENCLDVQLLPYCPVRDYIYGIDEFVSYRSTSNEEMQLKYQAIAQFMNMNAIESSLGGLIKINGDNMNQATYLFYSKVNKFSVNIPVSLESKVSRKVESNCNMYRIVSPNYQGHYDFNLATNDNAVVSNFIVNCTYKPYQPAIIVQPEYTGLNGTNYKDSRGLVVAGDFSLSQTTTPWINYQLNNKMYDKIFSRDIQNIQFTHGQERIQGIANMIGSSAMSTASSAGAGAMIGGVPGAIVGGVVGGGSSIAAGAVDLSLMGQRHQEALSYTIDKYNLNLASILAQPNIITKLSALDTTFKIQPVIEFYTCTDEERGLFKNKMQYDGYSLGVVDNISNYVYSDEHYLKARIIRISDDLDNHITTDINNEFNKGLYIKGE